MIRTTSLSLHLLLALLVLVIAISALATQPGKASVRSDHPARESFTATGGRLPSLASLLGPDGMLKLDTGFSGSLDARGYSLEITPSGAPRFVPSLALQGGGTDSWDTIFSSSGINAPVSAIAVSGNYVYIGGEFTSVGGIIANHIARWDSNTNTWSALTEVVVVDGNPVSFNGVNGNVLAIAVSGSDVYVGGAFTQAGSVMARNVAKWNGTSWSVLGSGLVNGVSVNARAIAVSGSEVYVGGDLSEADGGPEDGGVLAARIAKWNSSTNTWSALGGGVNGTVFAIAVSGSDVYVGGNFSQAGSNTASRIARWSSTTNTWSPLGTGANNGVIGSVRAIGVSGSLVYVGGLFTTAGGASANNVAVWNGSSWSELGTGIEGDDTITPVVNAIAVSGSNVYVGGTFATAGGVSASNVAKWDGSTWSALRGGVNGNVRAMAVRQSAVYVSGDFNTAINTGDQNPNVSSPFLGRFIVASLNTPPTLGTYPATTVNVGETKTISPSAPPSDDGTLSVTVSISPTTFTGNLSVNPSTGAVTVTDAGPAGSYTVTVTAVDNLNASVSTTFNLVVNGLPTIAGQTITRQQGSPGAVNIIATVDDDTTPKGNLSVAVTAPAAGISVTDITNTNGTITANVIALCTATVGTNQVGLTVTDGNGASATANLTVNVTTNTAPTLSYSSPQTAALGAALTVNPAGGPVDNGTVSSVTVQSITPAFFTGTITVNNAGVVSVSNAGPAGSYTVAIKATDNCGATTIAIFTLNVGVSGTPGCQGVSFTTPAGSPIAVGNAPRAIALGDFNNDGKPDLAAANSVANTVTILLGNGSGGFTAAAVSPATGLTPGAVVAGDFNSDGKLDLAIANTASNNVTILLGNGDGSFTAAVSPGTGNNPSAVAAGDFNSDGKLDLATANKDANNVTILLGNGDGSFTAATSSPATGSGPVSLAIGDFNADSKLDLAVANSGANTLTILLGNGDGSFTAATASPGTGTNPSSVTVGDFNGDGRLDLAVANKDANTVTILLGNGDGIFTSGTGSPTTGTAPSSLATGDFNSDGNLDLVVANSSSNDLTFLLGDGSGSFSAPSAGSPIGAGNNTVSVLVGDLNLDGRLDLAAVNQTDNNVTVRLNNCNTPPRITASGPITRQKGSSGAEAVIATVSDLDDPAGSLTVMTITGGTATGVTVTNIVNTDGTIKATIATDCNAVSGTIRLQVADSGALTASADLQINLTDNTLPVLGTYSLTGPVNQGASGVVIPSATPSDNGTVTTLTASAPNFTGTFDGDPTTGAVTINSAGPPGNYTVTVTATDNCSATSTATFNLIVNGPPAITGQTITRQQGSPGTVSTIAMVSDDLTAAGNLVVTVSSPATGISVTNIANNNGTITATVAADCTATLGDHNVGLTVTDGGGLTVTANLVVNVTANTPPALSYASSHTVVAGGSLTINPTSGPTDNGAIPSVTVQSISPDIFTGAISVNMAGVVSISNAGPAGDFTVTIAVTDNCNATSTASFNLSVSRNVRLVATSGAAGGIAGVPVELIALGDEFGVSFSVNFDPTLLSLADPPVVAGSGLPTGSSLNFNTNQAAQGRLGVALILPVTSPLPTFAQGTHQIAILNFRLASNAGPTTTTLSFGDQPIARSVVDANASSLSSSFTGAALTITRGYEADVTPRPEGKNNGTLTVSDWVQVGRFVAGLDPVTSGSEFQRADTAPRNTLGDGQLDISDWVQAGRYVAGLDPIAPAGGPTAPSSGVMAQGLSAEAVVAETRRIIRLVPGKLIRGQQTTVAVELEALGDENALAFGLSFDPAQLSFVSAAAPLRGATLIVNSQQAASGRLGLLLALPTGQAFAAGLHQLVTLTFAVAIDSPTDRAEIGFAGGTVANTVVDLNANKLAANWSAETFTLTREVACVSAASYLGKEIARASIVSAFGLGLATERALAGTLPLPTQLAGTTVKVRDAAGTERLAPLYFVSPYQVNYQLPAETAAGPATVAITSRDGRVSVGTIQVAPLAPGLFSADSSGQGVAAGYVVRLRNGLEQAWEPIAQPDEQGKIVARPVELGSEEEEAFLILYGTGLRARSSLASVTAAIGGVAVEVLYAGPAPGFVGLDQINLRLPRQLAGRGEVDVLLIADGLAANPVKVSIR